MRVIYIDIDSLRPDHLGAYGYHRNTSPNIDAIARESTRFEQVYVTDAPCLPSRTGLFSGRFGFCTGVVGHGGVTAQPLVEGATRGFRDEFGRSAWMVLLRSLGFRTVTVSSFGERHAAWPWFAGWSEVYNPGKRGLERADEVIPIALDWLDRQGRDDNWFLHINVWDPHTPFRTPADYDNPFADEPLPEWFTESMWRRCWEGYGPHSPQEANGFGTEDLRRLYPRHPSQIDSMATVREWVDGYDAGIRYADDFIGQVFHKLHDLNIFDETIIMIGADHGENIGELNVWGDHHTADSITCRVPLIVRVPGMSFAVNRGLHYHFDWAATLVELLGGEVPEIWDGKSFLEAFQRGEEQGRDYLITSQGAWACQRGVRFNHEDSAYQLLQTYHDGFKMIEPLMLFDLEKDPHETHNLAADRPDLVREALAYLNEWQAAMMQRSRHDVDPLMTVLREGGPFHTRGELPAYLERLRRTGRAHHAETLARLHPDEVG
jgi:choline-sulfatase